jgi:hypothetical protein
MKIKDLNNIDRETLEHTIKMASLDKIREDIADPPTKKQLQLLRFNGYCIGPNQEVRRLDCAGMLRECYNGLPCYWRCGGLADGKCKQIEFPSCGVADGACMLTGEPCNKYCEAGK